MVCNKLQECFEHKINQSSKAGQGQVYKISCQNNSSDCIGSSDKRSEVKCEERKKKYVLKNTSGRFIISYKMDGGIIVVDKSVEPNFRKCDYLYCITDSKEGTGDSDAAAILIELKGRGVSDAVKQVLGTLKYFKTFWNNFAHIYVRIVVTSSTPNLKSSPDYVELYKLIKNVYKGDVIIKENKLSDNAEAL